MDNLVAFLLTLEVDNDKALCFVDNLKCIYLKKFEHFQLQDAFCRYMGYVDSGSFRYYKTDRYGNERTLWFNRSYPFIGDYHSFLHKSKAELSVQAMDDYEIVLFTYNQMMELFLINEHTLKLRSLIAERSMFGWRNIALALYFDSAEERYLKLLDNYPNIENEIPLKYVASCLGISPETLSRIRKKLHQKK